MSSNMAILSYFNASQSVSGGTRRVNELLLACGSENLELFQPGRPHPQFRTFRIGPDFGRRRVGINWGMFNYFWPPTARRVRQRIAEMKPSCLVLSSIWAWAPFSRHGYDGPVILDAHNVDATALAERYGTGHPFTRLLAHWERKVARRAVRITACSDVDRCGFSEAYGIPSEKIDVVPNGASLPSDNELSQAPSLDPALKARLAGSTVCLFIGGKLDYPPNAEGVDFISNTLMPALQKITTERYKVIIVGTPVPARTLHPDLITVGRVPSLTPYLQRADICLAPIFSGSGTRLKALDYLAWAKPMVATPKAIEGIDCHHEKHALLADGEGFAAAVERFRLNPDVARHCGMNGRKLVADHYDWETLKERWRRSLQPWLNGPPNA